MSTVREEIVSDLKADLASIEERVVTGIHLSDLIRIGSSRTVQTDGWGDGNRACALSAAALGAVAMEVLPE